MACSTARLALPSNQSSCCPPFPPAVNVNSVTSFDTEMPYDYYSLPFCTPESGVKRVANSANPGTILQGLRMYNSPYDFSMKASL